MRRSISIIFAVIMNIVLLCNSLSHASFTTNEDNGYLHLNEVMDKYHKTFDVYTNRDAGGNHFFETGWMGFTGDIKIFDSAWIQNPYSGTSCIKINYSPSSPYSWAGVYWQNPENNWGDMSNAGYDLTGAKAINFYGRSEKDGVMIEFFALGIGRDPYTGSPISAYPDSSPKVSLGYITLSENWQLYTINLTGINLSYVIGGFGWVTNWFYNPSGATFYLDEIQYDLPRLDEPRFLRSYETIKLDDPDFVLTNPAYTYDNALASLAYIARYIAEGNDDDKRRTRLILDAFIIAQENDRWYTDGRLRNSYMSGDLLGQDGKARLPGWWDDKANAWYEDKVQVSTNTGNLAWVMIAFLRYYQDIEPDPVYLNAAITLGDWILDNTYDSIGIGGFTAGYEGEEPDPAKLTYKSSEHNIDLYSAFMNLYQITKDYKWLESAYHALRFLEAMWDEVEGHFWIGTTPDGQKPWNDIPEIQPMDVNTWGFMALGTPEIYGRGIRWVEKYCSDKPDDICNSFEGFDYNADVNRAAVWFEGTGQMVVSYQLLGEEVKAEHYLNEIREVQNEGPNNNGKGIISACPEPLDTYLGWSFYSRLHVGATSWYLLAERRYNPLRVEVGDYQIIHLDKGWNLISFFLKPLDSNPAKVLLSIAEEYNSMWSFDPDTGWSMYAPQVPDDVEKITEVKSCKGYWLNMKQPANLIVMGTPPEAKAISLKKDDWNMVGYCCRESKEVEQCIATIKDYIEIIWGYKPDKGWSSYPEQFKNLEIMEPGCAYWIKTSQDCIWDFGVICR